MTKCSVVSKVLIVEDDRNLIHVFEAALRSEGFEVVIAFNGVEALRAVQLEKPDIIILDPGLSWLSGTRIHPVINPEFLAAETPIIILNPKQQESGRFLDTREVIAHVRTLQQRTLPTGGNILRAGVLQLDLEGCTVSVEEKPVVLTTKEFGLLRILIKAKGRVLTRDILREIVWEHGEVYGLESRTVDVHIGRLRRKLGSAGGYIITVRGLGYRFGVFPEQVSDNCHSKKND